MADKVEIKELDAAKELNTINYLRVALLEEIQNLRAGKTTPAHINAITNATGKVFSSVKLELEYAGGGWQEAESEDAGTTLEFGRQ